MKALGELLVGMGWQITGSDSRLESLRGASAAAAAFVASGHCPSHLPNNIDVLVHSPAIDAANVEVQAARDRGVPCLTYPQMLGELMLDRRGVAVCGTHGKSTTTAMIGWILSKAGLSPSVIMGAELGRPRRSGWAGTSDLFVAEACEYRRAFLEFEPEMIVMLGQEPDHFDCFESAEDQTEAFAAFADRLTPGGTILANMDCRATVGIVDSLKDRVTRFSMSGPIGWRAQDVCSIETGMMFRACHGETYHCDLLLPLFGRHNVMNTLAAVAVAAELGVTAAKIEAAVLSFPGIGRRFEELATVGGVTLVDDYAHHPTAITATLRAARQKYPRRRLVVVFEPHQHSRTSALFDDFAQSLSKADQTLIAPIFAAREDVGAETCLELSGKLAESVVERGGAAEAVASLDQVITTLDDSLEPGDVLLTLGAGNIDRIPHEFIGRFQRHSEAG